MGGKLGRDKSESVAGVPPPPQGRLPSFPWITQSVFGKHFHSQVSWSRLLALLPMGIGEVSSDQRMCEAWSEKLNTVGGPRQRGQDAPAASSPILPLRPSCRYSLRVSRE